MSLDSGEPCAFCSEIFTGESICQIEIEIVPIVAIPNKRRTRKPAHSRYHFKLWQSTLPSTSQRITRRKTPVLLHYAPHQTGAGDTYYHLGLPVQFSGKRIYMRNYQAVEGCARDMTKAGGHSHPSLTERTGNQIPGKRNSPPKRQSFSKAL